MHVGDILGADSLERVRKSMLEFDEHITLGTAFLANGEVAIVLSVTGVYAPGGVLGGIQGGVIGGTVGSGPMGGIVVSPPAVPPAADGTKRITIGGNVQQAKLVSQPKPAYPPLAKQARVSGVVHLQAIIGKDGNVIDLKVISGPPLLIPSALEAVQQWVYQKTLLNGEPVEISTQIDVNYTLSDDLPIPQQ